MQTRGTIFFGNPINQSLNSLNMVNIKYTFISHLHCYLCHLENRWAPDRDYANKYVLSASKLQTNSTIYWMSNQCARQNWMLSNVWPKTTLQARGRILPHLLRNIRYPTSYTLIEFGNSRRTNSLSVLFSLCVPLSCTLPAIGPIGLLPPPPFPTIQDMHRQIWHGSRECGTDRQFVRALVIPE